MLGIILRERYLIQDKLGEGGFGETYLAEDFQRLLVLKKPKRVVKRLRPGRREDQDIVNRFHQEAAILYELGSSHEQIPIFIDHFEYNQDFYLVQQYIEGHDLSYEINDKNKWNENQVVEFLQEMLDILAYIHQKNIIHRDIKPSNIMRRYCDNKLILIDFGAVKRILNSQEQISSTIEIGTRCYMPSEQAQGHPRFSSDIYALGLTAVQALTGLTPNQLAKNERFEFIWREHAQVSDWLAEILNKMICYDFRQRYFNATEALQALIKNLPLLPSNVALEPFVENNRWGYKDENGNVLIQPQFIRVGEFSEGLARVTLGDKNGYIDMYGTVVIQPTFAYAGNFSEGIARVMNKSKFGFINKKAEFINQTPFDAALDFSEGLAAVKIGNNWGYINHTGELVIQPKFEVVEDFYQGQARVWPDKKWDSRLINRDGNFID